MMNCKFFFRVMLLLLVFFLSSVSATDLKVHSITYPRASEFVDKAVTPEFHIENQTYNYAETGSNWYATMKIKLSNVEVWSVTVPGVDIAAFSTVKLTAGNTWIPNVAGTYEIVVSVVYGYDVNPGNNTSTYYTTVYDKPSQALNPSPGNFSTTTKLTPQRFSFDIPSDQQVTSFNFNFAQTPGWSTPEFGTPVTVEVTEPGTCHYDLPEELEPGNQCTWRVDLTNEAGTTEGELWHVTVEPDSTDLEAISIEVSGYRGSGSKPTIIVKNNGPNDVLASQWTASVNVGGAHPAPPITYFEEEIDGVDIAAGDSVELAAQNDYDPEEVQGDAQSASLTVNYSKDTKTDNNSIFDETSLYGSPAAPTDPEPADDATDQPYEAPVDFQFTVPEGIPTQQFEIFISVDPPGGTPDFTSFATGVIEMPGQITYIHTENLMPGAVYFWRVDCTNPAGTTEGDVWTFTTQNITGVEEETENGLPTKYSLEQNYPNPFNPTTTISYSVPEQSFVNLTVFNSNGSEIKVLVNEPKAPGVYRVRFDAESLSTGVYLYRIKAGDFVTTKKAILIR